MENLNIKFDPTDYADPLFGVGSATSAGPTLPACGLKLVEVFYGYWRIL